MLLKGQPAPPAEEPGHDQEALEKARKSRVRLIRGDTDVDRNQKISMEHFEAKVNVGLEKRGAQLSQRLSAERINAAKRLKADHGIVVEDGRVEFAKEVGRAGARDYKSTIGGFNKTFEETTAAWIASSASSISGILAFLDRNLDAARGTQGQVGNLDLLSAMAQGQSEQFAEQSDLNKIVYDSVGLLNSLASSQALYAAGGVFAGAALTTGYFGSQVAGNDILRMENLFDKQSGKALATPTQILKRAWADLAIQGGLEAAGAGIVAKGAGIAKRVPGSSRAINQATNWMSSTLQRHAGRSKQIADYAARLTGGTGMAGVGEAFTEFWQSVTSDAIVNTIDPANDLIDAVDWSEAVYSAALGGISGGLLGSIYSAKNLRKAQTQEYASQLPDYDTVAGEREAADLNPDITEQDFELAKFAADLDVLHDPNASTAQKEEALGSVFGETKNELEMRLRGEAKAQELEERAIAIEERTMRERAKGADFEPLAPADAAVSYLQAREANPRKETLTNYSAEDLNQSAIYKRTGTDTFFLLRPGQDEKGRTVVDLAGLFNNAEKGGAIPWAVDTALAQVPPDVSLTLDAFDGFLPEKYAAQGFVEHGRVPFDPQYATPEMIASLQQEPYFLKTGKMPDVVFMHHRDRPWDGKEPEVETETQRRKSLDEAELAAWGSAAAPRYDSKANDTFTSFAPPLPAVLPTTEKGKAKSVRAIVKERQARLVEDAISGAALTPAVTGLGKSIGGPGYDSLMVSTRDIGKMESYNLMHARPLYIFERIQGDKAKGWATSIFHDPFVAANAEYQRRMFEESGLRGKYKYLIQANGGERAFGRDMFERQSRDTDPDVLPDGLTGQERVGIALASLDKDAKALLLKDGFVNQAGNEARAMTEDQINAIVNNLTPTELDVVAKLRSYWNQQHPRLVEAANAVGISIGKVENYYPTTGEVEHTGTDVARGKRPGDLVGTKALADKTTAMAEDFFTKSRGDGVNRRVNISALDVWQAQGSAAEYWMTHALPLANAMSVLNNGKFRDLMNSKYGKAKSREPEFGQTSVLQILDHQMQDVARNSTASTSMGEEWLAKLRRNAGPALLGLKLSVQLKQPLSYATGIFEYAAMGRSTGESMNSVVYKALKNAPATLYRALKHEAQYQAARLGGKPLKASRVDKLIDSVPAIEERLTGRGIDPLIDDMLENLRDKGSETKQGVISIAGRKVKRSLVKASMEGIMSMDRMTVRAMADFIIRNELAGGATEAQAVFAAQRAIEKTQPMSGNLYLPVAYRSGELVRSMTLFTGEINQFGNLGQQVIRQMVGPNHTGEDMLKGLYFLALLGINTYLVSGIDSAGRSVDPRAKESQDFYKMNVARFGGMAAGGVFGGMAANTIVNHLYYNGVFSDAPAPPGLSIPLGVVGKATKAWKKPEYAQMKALTKELASAAGIGWGLPMAGAWNLVQGWSDAIASGELDLNSIAAAGGFSRFARGVAASSKTGKPVQKKTKD